MKSEKDVCYVDAFLTQLLKSTFQPGTESLLITAQLSCTSIVHNSLLLDHIFAFLPSSASLLSVLPLASNAWRQPLASGLVVSMQVANPKVATLRMIFQYVKTPQHQGLVSGDVPRGLVDAMYVTQHMHQLRIQIPFAGHRYRPYFQP